MNAMKPPQIREIPCFQSGGKLKEIKELNTDAVRLRSFLVRIIEMYRLGKGR